MPLSTSTTNYGDDDRIESSEQAAAPDDQSPAALAAESAAKAGESLAAMNELEQRGEDLLQREPRPPALPEFGDVAAFEPPEPPRVDMGEEPMAIPPAKDLLKPAPDVAAAHGKHMDRLTAKIPKRQPVESSRPRASRRERAANTPFSEMTAKQKRALPREQFKAMHDLTAKAQELGGDAAKDVEIGGLGEADAEVVAIPREDTPEALKRRWKDKEEANKEFRTALVGLLGLEAEGLAECTRQIERIHSQLERTRYY